jgi:nocturnin
MQDELLRRVWRQRGVLLGLVAAVGAAVAFSYGAALRVVWRRALRAPAAAAKPPLAASATVRLPPKVRNLSIATLHLTSPRSPLLLAQRDADLPAAGDLADLLAPAARLGWPSLYAREMRPTPAAPGGPAPELRLKVMQFNVLAEGLSSSPTAQTPFPAQKAGNFGGFDLDEASAVCLHWENRKWRLLEEVLRWAPDVVALEEVDHFSDFLEPALDAAGYSGVFAPKGRAPGLNFGYYSDGTAIFWRRQAIEAVRQETGYYTQADGAPADRPYVLVTLRPRGRREHVLVGATHLKAKEGQANEDLRAADIAQLLDAMAERVGQRSPQISHSILLGDFNTDPPGVPAKHTARCVPAVLAHRLGLRSAYPIPLADTEWTTWKRRSGTEIKHRIDYIFHSPSLRAAALLAPPATADLEPARLPSLRYPSDHLAIMAELVVA